MKTYLTGELQLNLLSEDRDADHPYRTNTDQLVRLYVRGTSVAEILDLLAHQIAVLQMQKPSALVAPASD